MHLSRGLMRGAVLMVAVMLAAGVGAVAEEGMWTFDNPPITLLKQKYGFVPTQAWLDHLRLSSVRLNDGGSGAFVSVDGLLLTNHHVARGQLQKNSTPAHDYIMTGFYAATEGQEMKSPDLEVNVLVSMQNVTAWVQSAVKPGMESEAAFKARQAVTAAIESESLKATGLRSDVISLYQGGEYWLYRYKKYTDVRIVFAPEEQAAFFGGDPDNFTYPRYDLDIALFRVYENGKPIHSENYLKWNAKGPMENELLFVSGNPGSTQRDDTVAQLSLERDIVEPSVLKVLRHRIAVLKGFEGQGPEQAREAETQLFFLENSRKAFEGRLQGLLDLHIFGKKVSEEMQFREKVSANPAWQNEYGGAWAQIEEATKKNGELFKKDLSRRTDSPLFGLGLSLVQYAVEVQKPDGERLPGFHDSRLESLRYSLLSPAPVYPDMERARMAGSLQQALEELGPSDPWVRLALDGKSPTEAARAYIGGSKLADPSVRRQLLEGGETAIAASTDPLIVLAKRLDPLIRAMLKQIDVEVKSVETSAGEKLGKVRFLVYGKDVYPDATFTLRLSYGTASGYPMNGTRAPYKTTYYGLYDRSASFNNQSPFNLPQRYLACLIHES